MNRFDDLLPEEIDPQHKELITLLQHAYRKPVLVSPMQEAQVMKRVRERLMQLELEASLNKDMLEPQIGVLNPFSR